MSTCWPLASVRRGKSTVYSTACAEVNLSPAILDERLLSSLSRYLHDVLDQTVCMLQRLAAPGNKQNTMRLWTELTLSLHPSFISDSGTGSCTNHKLLAL